MTGCKDCGPQVMPMPPLAAFKASIGDAETVLTIGDATGEESALIRAKGNEVIECDYGRFGIGYLQTPVRPQWYGGIYCSHTLEHERNPGAFLDRLYIELGFGGVLCIVVPPRKDAIVGGHVTLWNAGLLLYHLILARFDCKDAHVITYAYNVAVLVRKREAAWERSALLHDQGDIETLARYFPFPVEQGFDGMIVDHQWGPV